MKASIKFASYETAKAFATAWSRYSKRGYSLSPRKAEGGATLTLDGVTENDREWIDAKAAELIS